MKRSKKGFTLVELLVVIAIIAIIAAVAVPVTISQINKAKIGTAVDEANQVKTNAANVITEMATSPAGEVTAAGLATGLSEFYTEMKQVDRIYVAQAAKDGDILVTIVTKTAAPAVSDATKGYIAVEKNTADIAATDPLIDGTDLTGPEFAAATAPFVAVQFKMKGKGVNVVSAPGTHAAIVGVKWGTGAFAADATVTAAA